MRYFIKPVLFSCLSLLTLSACESLGVKGDTSSYPQPEEIARREKRGTLSGDEGLVSFGGPDTEDDGTGGNNPLGVNSFLWRATLDTVAFLPIASADPFGGVVLTDWYEDPETPGERFKVNALILDRSLRANSIRISLFRQIRNEQNVWNDAAISKSKARALEDAILTRARQLRVSQLGY
jgi:hypothetical protein